MKLEAALNGRQYITENIINFRKKVTINMISFSLTQKDCPETETWRISLVVSGLRVAASIEG